MIMILLSTLSVMRHLIFWQQLELSSEVGSDLRDTVGCGRKRLVEFNGGKKLSLFRLTGIITLVLLMWKGWICSSESIFQVLSSELLSFSSELHWGNYNVSISKTAVKKMIALISSTGFLSREVALYLYESTVRPCMKYCCHVWAGALSCYLDILDKLQKRVCRIVGATLATSLEPLAHHRNVAS